ncbi:MAG: AAA family ATPase [Phocaeicola sp.]
MKIFKELTINNFRGFDYIKVENLGQVNLFLGKNCSGKSSLLEAIFLLTGLGNPQSVKKITAVRCDKEGELFNLKYLFHKANIDNLVVLHATLSDGEERNLKLLPYFGSGSREEGFVREHDIHHLKGVDLKGTYSKAGSDSVVRLGRLAVAGKERKLTNFYLTDDDEEDRREDFALYVTLNKDERRLLKAYAILVMRNKKKELLASLKLFDERITEIEALRDGIYLRMEGMEELLPLNMTGDGLRRFFKLALGINAFNSRIIVIDEIDNGLHYSAYKLLWKSILALCHQKKLQLFITTHSLEAIISLEKVLRTEITEMQEALRLYTIEDTKTHGFQAHGHSYEEIKDTIEEEIRMRRV